jgi:16S rRNA (cytosine1402-N4)-methyltransferase
MLLPCLEGLSINPDGTYVDVTFGGGGHSKAILERLSANGHLYAFDQDADAEQNIPADDRFTFVRSNFRYLRNWLRYYGAIPVDGILADLGVSSHHFDTMERGFSIREDGPLDMRMNQQATRTAAEIVNGYDAGQLAEIFDWYGELHNARAIANAIIRDRQANGEIRTTTQLHKAVSKQLNPAREKKDLAKVFQALRIEVNDELVVLKEMLSAAIEVLKPGGRLVVMSYHSLEDRLVKNFMRSGNAKGLIEKDFYGNPISVLRQLKGYPISPSEQEQEQNPRSRSAKLRVAEKTKEQ